MLQIDIKRVPFSRYGAYLALMDFGGGRLRIINSMEKWGAENAYDIEFAAGGKKVSPEFIATPVCVKAVYQGAEAFFYIRNDFELVVKSEGFDLSFIALKNGYGIEYPDNKFEVSDFNTFYTTFKVFKGNATLTSKLFRFQRHWTSFRKEDKKRDLHVTGPSIEILICLAEFQLLTDGIKLDIAGDLNKIEGEWTAFKDTMPKVRPEDEDFAATSWYNLWSSVGRKTRQYPYDVMYMSKKGMSAVWSWDHCFNALIMRFSDPKMSFENFYTPFTFQQPTGALPDYFSYNAKVTYVVTKPPIHGWAFRKIMEANPNLPKEYLEKAYAALSKQADWWLNYRDSDGDGIPDYPNSCDSGIDNATTWIGVGDFIESPDLPSYLILQMKALAELAIKLGRDKDAREWDKKAEGLKEKFFKHSVKDGYFVSYQTRTHKYNPHAECFLDIMPLVLGAELPEEYRDNLIKRLKERHLTEFGVSTEGYRNKRYYMPRGYWRGPIWAPTTYLLIDGLKRSGEKALAKDIALRYIHMVKDVAKGNYENFDALTGKGLCCEGYTWTAAVTLLLMHELYNKELE